jgi:hypothetical protein
MTNPWIEHIRKFSKKNNLSYSECLKNEECKNSYKKPQMKTVKTVKPMKKTKKQSTSDSESDNEMK